MRLHAALLASLFLAGATAASAAVPDRLEYFNGSWACTTTVGNGSQFSSSANAQQWGQWIRFNINTPAHGNMGATAGTGYLGWDDRNNRWVYSEIDSDGSYYMVHSESPHVGRSSWSDGYPNIGSNVGIYINGHNRYTVSSSWNDNGNHHSSTMACTRQ